MFIGWLKFADVNSIVKIAESHGLLVDGYHVKLMIMHAPHLCYGAYEKGQLVGAAMAVSYEKSNMVKYVMLDQAFTGQGIGKRLMGTLMQAMEGDGKDVYVHSNDKNIGFFDSFGFESQMEIGRFLNVGKVPPFSFTNANAKELDGSNFENIVAKIDHATFHENRLGFLFDEMERSSSLKFALPHSFQHSSVINARSVYLGPWQVAKGEEIEAEKMMKGVLYFRGLKKVAADVPMGNALAVDLYKRFHFEKKERYVHMRKGKNITISFENIYAFSL